MTTTVLAAGLPESVGGAVMIAGTIVLLLMLVALGAFAYKSLTGDGIEWPDDGTEDPDGQYSTGGDEELTKGGEDDEWKYY